MDNIHDDSFTKFAQQHAADRLATYKRTGQWVDNAGRPYTREQMPPRNRGYRDEELASIVFAASQLGISPRYVAANYYQRKLDS